MKNIKEAFGKNLHGIRKSKKLTIEACSEMLDITPRQLSKIESGDTFLTSETLCKISVSLGVSLQELFDFDWDDKRMYYDNNKYIKIHFKVIKSNSEAKLKSQPALKGFNINKKMPFEEVTSFLLDFSHQNNMTIYTEYFFNKIRDKVIKITPNGNYSFLVGQEEIKYKQEKNKNYYYITEKVREFSTDEIKLDYIKTAIEALSSKKSLERLKAFIKGIEISK